jgi:hypothetical protein
MTKKQNDYSLSLGSNSSSEHETFHIGFDWVLDRSGRPYLLEYQLHPSGLDEHTIRTPCRHFLDTAASKIHQHQLLPMHMPPYCTDTGQFSSFADEHKRVVYKLAQLSEGKGVHIFSMPPWQPDFVEKFIEPQTVTRPDGEHAYIIRDLWVIDLKRNIRASHKSTARKLGMHPITADAQQAYNLTISRRRGTSTADRDTCTGEEQLLVMDHSKKVLGDLAGIGHETGWDPRRVFDKALLVYWFGMQEAFFGIPNEDLNPVQERLTQLGVPYHYSFAQNDPEQVLHRAKLGLDALLLRNYYSYREDIFDLKVRVHLRKEDDSVTGNVYGNDMVNGKVNVTSAQIWRHEVPSNVHVLSEDANETIAQKIAESYQSRR